MLSLKTFFFLTYFDIVLNVTNTHSTSLSLTHYTYSALLRELTVTVFTGCLLMT